MQIQKVLRAGINFEHTWPDRTVETYPSWIDYQVRAEDGIHEARIAFGERQAYGALRVRILVLIDGHPHLELLGADDFDSTGEVLAEIKIHEGVGEKICRYPDEAVPDRYAVFNITGLPMRVSAKAVHGAWAVVTNLADHKALIALGLLRRSERK